MDNAISPGAPAATAEKRGTSAPAARGAWRHWLWGILGGAALALGWEAVHVLCGPNFHCVVPGATYRSAQPSADWLKHTLAQHGIRTVINLRGNCGKSKWYLEERRVTAEAGAEFEDVMLSALSQPEPRLLRQLVQVLDTSPRPVLLHCRGGADRSGLAAALFLLLHSDATVGEARGQLSLRYGHNPFGRSACLHRMLDQYEHWLASEGVEHTPARLRAWIDGVYEPEANASS